MFFTMIDIDNFKILNDTYDHQVGDNVLKRFSQILLNLDYKQKKVGRYGNNEFSAYGFAIDTKSRNFCLSLQINK